MLSRLAIALLALSPSMAGPPKAALGSSGGVVDATQSFALTGPATAAQCTDAAVTTDQGGAITVSRASTSWCQQDDGTYVLVSANHLVVEADGMRIEPASTNRVPYSEDLTNNWTQSNVAANGVVGNLLIPGGGNVASWNTSSSGGLLTSPSFTITGTSAVLSAWMATYGAGTATLVLRDTTAGADRCTISVTSADFYSHTMTGRNSCFSSSITSGNTHVVRFYPGSASGTNTDSWVFGVMVEPGTTVMSSYIQTTGTAVTRAADVVSASINDNTTSGCIRAVMKNAHPVSATKIFSKAGDVLAVNAVSQIYSSDSTNTVFTGGGASDFTNRAVSVRSQWSGSVLAVDLDSSAATGTGSFDGSMGSGTTLYFGCNAGVAQWIQGWLKAIKISTSAVGCTP